MKALPSPPPPPPPPPPPFSAPKYIDETMAQLPPKNPAFEPNPSCSWADEFLDFSAARRGAHRRSVSDSVAFLETAAPPEFDRLDEDQLLFMFSDHAAQPPPASEDNASVGSDDDNSVVDQKGGAKTMVKAEFEEAHSRNPAAAAAGASPADQIVDSKRVKRILANRQSAQRSRVRKLQYISELERSVNTLQTEVSALSPRVAFLDHQRSILTVGNSHLKQRIAALAQDKLFKDAHQEELKKEIERLRHVYRMQNLKNMEASPSPSPPPPPPVRGTGKESLC